MSESLFQSCIRVSESLFQSCVGVSELPFQSCIGVSEIRNCYIERCTKRHKKTCSIGGVRIKNGMTHFSRLIILTIVINDL